MSTTTMKRTARLPMALTLARLLAGPLIAWIIVEAHARTHLAEGVPGARLWLIAALIFILAALTDWLDGALARRMKAVTPLGAALDHVADKALIAAVLIALAYTALPADLVAAAIILIVRDLVVAGLREHFGAQMRVDRLGKLKAALAMSGVALFLVFQAWALISYGDVASLALFWAARVTLWASAILSLVSAMSYVRAIPRS